MGGEAGLVERLDFCGGNLCLDALQVDFAVTRDADHESLALAVGHVQGQNHVLQRVARRPRAVGAGMMGIEVLNE